MDEVGIARHFTRPQRRRQRSLISSSLAPLHAKSLVTRTGRRTDFMRDSSSIKNSEESPPLSKLDFNCGNVAPAIGIVNHEQVNAQTVTGRKRLRRRHFFSARTSASIEENNADARSSVIVRPHETRIVLECIARLPTALPDNDRFPTSSRARDIPPIRRAWPK